VVLGDGQGVSDIGLTPLALLIEILPSSSLLRALSAFSLLSQIRPVSSLVARRGQGSSRRAGSVRISISSVRRRRFMRRKPRMGWEVRREVIPGAILGHCRVGNRKRSSLTPAFPSTRVDFRTPLQASPSVPMRSTVRVTARLSRDLLPGALFHATFRFRFR
jgi:hypothetical protein